MSALKAFDASKQNMSSPNMHAYRAIIDVCGLCGDYLKSRAIYEVFMLVFCLNCYYFCIYIITIYLEIMSN